eukprot:SAG31_NODE_27374_length_427_cov_0.628049_2_plen_76_part_01
MDSAAWKQQMAVPAAASMLPDAMQYRMMKQAHKTVATRRTEVRRSPIHAWGLFAKESFKMNEMVVEYTGVLIRSQL